MRFLKLQCSALLIFCALSVSEAQASSLDLLNSVGKTVTVQGRLKQFQSGRIGVLVNESRADQISIEALPCPPHGELKSEIIVDEHGQSVKHPKYRRHSQRGWIETDARLKKLDHLIEQYMLGESIELTGELCHLTSTIRGNVSASVHYPKRPESHYYFSVDDLIVSRKK